MAIEDYLPNIFGSVPSAYQGLLGTEETAALQRRSNIGGLLSAGAALAQGMSAQGPRRSALQNVLTALAAGYGGAGEATQSGIKNFANMQQLQLQQRQQAGVQAMKMKYPDLADEFDTNPAGAFRIVSEREAALRKPTTVGAGQTLVSPTGEIIFQAPTERKKNTAVVGNALIDLDTGMPIYEAAKPAKAPEVRDFADGTTRQYDESTQSWNIVARKPSGEEKSMYAGEPTVDANGKLVFLPKRPGLPVVDAQTGKPVDYAPKGKPLPSVLQRAEEDDYDLARSASNLANDANQYVNKILNGTIKFGLKEKGATAFANITSFGAKSEDVIERNDFNRWINEYTNESLRQNKGTQTESDAKRAVDEVRSAESKEDTARAILRLRDVNARRVQSLSKSVTDRRKNSGVGDPEVKIDVPKFEPVVITPSDYAKIPNGVTYIDVNGVRRTKGKRQ
jgi:hypothetical protein